MLNPNGQKKESICFSIQSEIPNSPTMQIPWSWLLYQLISHIHYIWSAPSSNDCFKLKPIHSNSYWNLLTTHLNSETTHLRMDCMGWGDCVSLTVVKRYKDTGHRRENQGPENAESRGEAHVPFSPFKTQSSPPPRMKSRQQTASHNVCLF